MINYEQLSTPFTDQKTVTDRKNFLDFMTGIKEVLFFDKSLFESRDINIYYYDDFTIKTNINNKLFHNVYIEINQDKNIKQQTKKSKFSIKKKNSLIKELHLSLKKIKNELMDIFYSNLNEDHMMWQDKYSVNMKITDNSKGETVEYYFKIKPCLTYVNEKNRKGILYYDNTEKLIEIEYPKLSIKNFEKKNKETNGLLIKYVLFFKNVFSMQKNTDWLPFEIIETLLYNVPNELFKELCDKSLITILNYLRNTSVKNCKSLDEQDSAFISKYKSLSIFYAKHVISQVEKFIKKYI